MTDNPRPTIQERFLTFHNANPEVYQLLVRYAREAQAAGRTHLGIGVLWERMRWYVIIETKGDGFKLNDNFRSRYVRMMIEEHPEFEHLFELRKLRAA